MSIGSMEDETVAAYDMCAHIFEGLLQEVRELSKKKPETVFSDLQIKIINRVLDDVKKIFEGTNQETYLDRLDETNAPRNCDVLMVMVQYESALKEFKTKDLLLKKGPFG